MSTASWPARPLLPPSRLEPCIALALLLHIWLVLVLGSAPGGSARPGDGVWGRVGGVIDVRLNGLLGGDAAPHPSALPPQAAPTKTGPVGSAKQERFGGAVRSPEPEPAEPTPPGAARIGRWNAQAGDVEANTPPNRVTALPTEALRPAVLPSAGAANLALQPMPAAPPTPVLVPVRAAVPVPLPAPIIERLPEPVAAAIATPVAAPAPDAEVPLPRVEATPAPTPVPAPAPPTSPAATAPTPAPAPAATATSTTSTTSTTPSASASPSLATAPAPAGSPDAGSRLGRDVATPASTPPTAAREPLNLALPRGAAVSRSGGSGLLQLMPHPPERKSKLEESVDAAAKADCRKAYAGAGLLAAVPLLIDAARDKGCRW